MKIMVLLQSSKTLTKGVRFSKTEATEFFFATTKLFQSDDLVLRRLVYLILKELSPYAQDMIIIVSSLTKDINSDNHIYKSNAIRVLCCILSDLSLLGQGERYLRQAIVDREPTVGSAALVSGVHLMNSTQTNADIVKRWLNEITEACKGKEMMVQYHALGLLYQIKCHDRQAIIRLLREMIRNVLRSSHARCLLIRFTGPILKDLSQDESAPFWDFLSSSLRHKSDMVTYEAARTVCQLDFAPEKVLVTAISVLQMFLSSSKAVLRFAAVRTLNQVAMRLPFAVQVCNSELEMLITDSNRNVATLAITTLLKTATFESVDRLVRQLSTFMDDISDEFKIVVVNAICSLAVKFPPKHRTLMAFLADALRDEGGIEFKRAIVNAMLTIIEMVPAAKEMGLAQLCEFIEDCEFTSLSTRVLTLLGREGPTSKTPSRLIRYVYNRVILENATIRAAAVSVLGKFAVAQPSLRSSIAVLLNRCLFDNDDEVRDRATLALQMFQQPPEASSSVLPSFSAPLRFSLASLERSLLEYKGSACEDSFDPSAIPEEDSRPLSPRLASAASSASSAGGAGPSSSPGGSNYAEILAAVPELAGLNLGALLNSSQPVQLTESETEYVVSCVKHTFAQHAVFQFNITNTLADQVLNRVSVEMQIEDDESTAFKAVHFARVIPSGQIPCKVSDACYTVFRRDVPPSNTPSDGGEDDEGLSLLMPTGSFACTMKFSVHEFDSASKQMDDEFFDDEYEIEAIELNTADYIRKATVPNWTTAWGESGEDGQAIETFNLASAKNVADAVSQITSCLGMLPCDDSGPSSVQAAAPKHILYLSGSFIDGTSVLVRVRMRRSPLGGVDLELAARSSDSRLSVAICRAISA